MKFSPLTKSLYTDSGVFIKKLECPLVVRAGELVASDRPSAGRCGRCESLVWDTADLTDEALFRLVQADPDTCLKVDLDQANLTVVYRPD